MRKRLGEQPGDAVGNAVHIGRIAVGGLPNDIRPDEGMQAKLLMETQSIIDGREAEWKAAGIPRRTDDGWRKITDAEPFVTGTPREGH